MQCEIITVGYDDITNEACYYLHTTTTTHLDMNKTTKQLHPLVLSCSRKYNKTMMVHITSRNLTTTQLNLSAI